MYLTSSRGLGQNIVGGNTRRKIRRTGKPNEDIITPAKITPVAIDNRLLYPTAHQSGATAPIALTPADDQSQSPLRFLTNKNDLVKNRQATFATAPNLYHPPPVNQPIPTTIIAPATKPFTAATDTPTAAIDLSTAANLITKAVDQKVQETSLVTTAPETKSNIAKIAMIGLIGYALYKRFA